MAEPRFEFDKLVSFLSYRPDRLFKSMIEVERPPSPPPTLLVSVSKERISSLGALDCFPPEITCHVLSMLDLQSLANVARTSSRGNAFVEGSYAFQDLVTSAPEVLVALRKLSLGGLHSITELYAAMQTQECANCFEYGAFLFLPTCERCCWKCLRNDPSFRVILHEQARQYFGLSTRQLMQLPALDVIPGKYGIWGDTASQCSLVSVKAAKELAVKVHGSEDNLVRVMEKKCENTRLVSTGRYYMGEAALRGKDLRPIPNPGHIPIDNFFGMASIPFASISSSSNMFEYGLWCRGCEVTNLRYDHGRLPNPVLRSLVPRGRDPSHALLSLERRARSRNAFLLHLRHCYGAHLMVPSLGPFTLPPLPNNSHGHT
ncbi:hypothetical protein B0J13DRAFT_183895 [Dactylonectria estremocensis]|uniref:F-box domain-containing protein n=1 Tax=Dactylonectria estremocensis TaxID=1079267 RepID=A0A9P9FC76_9HYPO|nr:hypothetical protein B0J13DRAFT_183895 [Dactylonectria estremocensis]